MDGLTGNYTVIRGFALWTEVCPHANPTAYAAPLSLEEWSKDRNNMSIQFPLTHLFLCFLKTVMCNRLTSCSVPHRVPMICKVEGQRKCHWSWQNNQKPTREETKVLSDTEEVSYQFLEETSSFFQAFVWNKISRSTYMRRHQLSQRS